MRNSSSPTRRRLSAVGATFALAATMLAVTVTATASSSAATVARPNPLSDKLQRLLHPELAGASALADSGLHEITSGPGSLTTSGPGRVTVEIRVAAITLAQVAAVKNAGASIYFTDKPTRTLTASIAVDRLEALAAVPGVEYVGDVLRPQTSSTCNQGIKVSEGDTHVNAANARTNKSVTGHGVKVGILSDSFAKAAAPQTTQATDISNGDLPGSTNTCTNQSRDMVVTDFTSGTDEGRGMTQLVHDLAPQADLDFSTANNTEAIFANNIRNLQTAGAKVIVDDITYFAEPMYQDGVVAKAVQDVTDAGTVYYSSAANNNFNVGGLPAASYEAPAYRPMACPSTIAGSYADCHDWDPGAGTDDGDDVTFNSNTTLRFIMGWNEPQFGVNTDFDLYLLNPSTNAVILSSTQTNSTSNKAFEFIGATSGGSTVPIKIVVARKSSAAPSGTPRFKIVFAGNGAQGFTAVQWSSANSTDTFGPTTFGHNAKINAASVAAVRYDTTTNAEFFTSKGPATYCWGPVVGAVPATALAGGCVDKQIDMAATDGAATTFFGQNVGGVPPTFRFFGTSAAAPHAAAVAALMLEARPCATPAQIIAAQKSTAHAVGTETTATVGSGLIDADLAIGALAQCPPVIPTISPITTNEGDVVSVDFSGTASQPAGHTLTYGFAQTSGPTVSFIQTPATTQRKFIAPRTAGAGASVLTFDLTANDLTNATSTVQSISVTVNNNTPVAVPSAPKLVTTGGSVILQGASNDAIEPDVIPSGTNGRQYSWSQTGGPSVTLTPGSGAGFRQASFTPSTPGVYTFQLVVTDHGGFGLPSVPASVTVEARTPAPAGTLSGVVKDGTGSVLSGATVDVFANSTGGSPVATTTSNGSGAWSVAGLTAGVPYFVRFSKAGLATRWQNDGINPAFVLAINTPKSLIDATLPSTTRTITGSVVNSGSTAVSGITVRLVDESGPADVTTTNGAGTYSFTGLSSKATYRVQIAPSDPTFATAWVTSDGRGAPAGNTGVPVLFINTTSSDQVAATTTVYNKTTELRTLTVTVKNASNVGISGAEVRLYNPGNVGTQRTNASGVYTITGIRPGNTYLVWVWTKCSGCTANAFGSQWNGGIPGEQYDQSGKLASPVDLTVNQGLTFTLS